MIAGVVIHPTSLQTVQALSLSLKQGIRWVFINGHCCLDVFSVIVLIETILLCTTDKHSAIELCPEPDSIAF